MESNDETVKPQNWNEFIGQPLTTKRLQTHIKAAVIEKRSLEHLLLAGPPGYGKTTLADLVIHDLHDPVLRLHGVGLDRKQMIASIRRPMFVGGVIFIDEIHAIPKRDQEFLLDFLGRGVIGNEEKFSWVTVVGATTERDLVIKTLYERFIIRPEFETYTDEDLGKIVAGMAKKIRLKIDRPMAEALGRAAGGVPRNAKQFVFAARALLSTAEKMPNAEQVLDFCQVDSDGLGILHLKLMDIVDSQGKASERTICNQLRITPGYCRELERLLLDHKLLTYSSSGRVLTPTGAARHRGETHTQDWTRP